MMRYIVKDKKGTIYDGSDFKEAKRQFLANVGKFELMFESVKEEEE